MLKELKRKPVFGIKSTGLPYIGLACIYMFKCFLVVTVKNIQEQ